MSFQYLVVGDTNNIIDYIYATTKYKHIRGASIILDKLNLSTTQTLAENHNGEILSASGGEFRVLFQDEKAAEKFNKELRKSYLEATDDVTISSTIVSRKENEPMGLWVKRAESDLRLYEVAEGKKQFHTIPSAPIFKQCESCYKKAAVTKVDTIDEGKLFYCNSCKHKEVMVRDVIKGIKDKDQAFVNSLTAVHKELIERDKDKESKWIKKVSHLLSGDYTDNYIGFIYMDGRNVGTLFRKVLLDETLSDEEFIKRYTEVSQGLYNCVVEAAVKTAQDFENLECYVDYAMLGGDDFAAIMTGRYAVPYTNRLITYFEELTKETFKKYEVEVQMAAGVVIAKSSYPVHRLFEMSYDLMSYTKERNEGSCLDFIVITDSTVQSVYSMKEQRSFGENHDKLYKRQLRTNGYSVNENKTALSYENLERTILQLKNQGFPRFKIKEVYDILLERDQKVMEYRWLLWRSRLGKGRNQTEDKRILTSILDEWNVNFAHTPFAFTKGDIEVSPLLDLFDLYDFIEEQSPVKKDDE
ncbi:Cas10/Cmr2 second palm domain-containing protein [Bacillus cereus group sp. Bce018]|uniref:Cas10/Cmr2 second palm domain-containing protein n=1 Tax=Bacillus cereus group sp. Bce018 TaxID=3445248 RepID=UPI003F294597